MSYADVLLDSLGPTYALKLRAGTAAVRKISSLDWRPHRRVSCKRRLGSLPDGYLLGSYRIATAPEANPTRLTSFKSIRFDSPANNVGP